MPSARRQQLRDFSQILALADGQMYHIPAKEEYADMKKELQKKQEAQGEIGGPGAGLK